MTSLDQKKLRIVAELARFFACKSERDKSEVLLRQTLAIAIRKLHDHGRSHLGKGKYLGHPHWSVNALRLLKENDGRVRGLTSKLSHEHVVPVSLQVECLLNLPTDADLDTFKNAITRYSIVAIITRDEDAQLRKISTRQYGDRKWIDSDPWWRYRAANLLDQIVGENEKSSASSPREQ